jgi:DHA2 family multidrug resistance protein-like MFS transporter
MFLDSGQRTFAIGIWITSYSVGGVIGPLVGGLLLEHLWWGSVFLVGVPVMVLLLAVGRRLLPEYRDPLAGRPDLLSAALSLAAVLSMIFGLKRMAQDGVGVVPVLTIVAGVAVGALFVRRQLRLPDPLIDLRLFGVRAFSTSLATYGLAILVLFGGFLFLPQYLQLVLGMSPLMAGLWTLPWALAFVVGSLVTPALTRRILPARLMCGGLLLASLGFGLFTRLGPSTGFALFAGGSSLFALGFSPVFTLTTDLVVGSAPPERAGAASAISETSGEFGGALGIAIFGSIGVALYRRMMAGALPPGLPADAVAQAQATLGGAVAVAAQLPGPLGRQLTETASAAFLRGIHVCAAISFVGSLGLAGLVLFGLRQPAAAALEKKARPDVEDGPAAPSSL